jgi:hypothetical protein
MNLTHEQMQTLAGGSPVPVTVERTRCILIREDVYAGVRQVVESNGSDESLAETYPAVVAAWDQEPDPGLDAYQDYKRR